MSLVEVREQAAKVARKIADEGADPTQKGLEWEWGFADGAMWAADRLPSRDEVARALWNLPDNSPDITDLERLNELADEGGWDYEEARDFLYRQADAVLALIRERIEGEA